MFDIVPYLSFLTSGIGLFFIFYLLVRFGHIKKVYGLVFIIFALVFLEFYIYALTSKHIYKMLFMLRTPNILRAFLPISLFFYVQSMLCPNRPIRSIQYLHGVFPVGVLIGIMPDLFLTPSAKVAILDAYYAHNNSSGICTTCFDYGWDYLLCLVAWLDFSIEKEIRGAIFVC
jgi:hypothetical protein